MLGTSSGAAHRALQHGAGCYIGERSTLRRCTRRNSSRRIVRAEGEGDGIGDLTPKPALRAPPPRPIPQPNRTAAVEQVMRTKKQGGQGATERGWQGDDRSSRNGSRPRPNNEGYGQQNGRNGSASYNGNGRAQQPPPPAAAAPTAAPPAENDTVTFTFGDPPVPAPPSSGVAAADTPPGNLAMESAAPSPPMPSMGGAGQSIPAPRPPSMTAPVLPPTAPQASAPALAGPPKMAAPPVRPIPRPQGQPRGPRPMGDGDRAPNSDVSTWKERREQQEREERQQGPGGPQQQQQGRDRPGPQQGGQWQQQQQGQGRGGPSSQQGPQGQQQWRAGPPPPPGYNGRPQGAPPLRQVQLVRDNTPDPVIGVGPGRGKGMRTRQLQAQNIGARRNNRAQRKAARYEERLANQDVREEIFEVGPEGMPVSELATKLAINTGEVIKTLFMKGIMVQANQVLDADTIKMVAAEFNVEVLDRDEEGVEAMARKTVDYVDEADLDYLQPRPPVVTVMGHVDHGKTSLLDYIRDSKVAAGEAGGITQAIGAYTCEVATGESTSRITFLDTPGHEAFSAMRARGTRVTDIAIIVVAADDGVRPQTLEAIGHARAAEVPIIVAINKMDKEGSNPERVKQELSEAGLLPEEWGGTAPMVPISAKTGAGIDTLLETVALVAEVEQLVANPDKPAIGTIIEAHLDRRTGAVATLLVAAGTLRPGDVVVAGGAYGKVRSLTGNFGEVAEAGPSIAVQMAGLNAVPSAGDEFRVCETEQEARRQAEEEENRIRLQRLAEQAGTTMVTTSSYASMDEADDTPADALQRLNIILKADASGTLEAVRSAVGTLPQDRVMLRFLLAAPSDITASDVDLAYASGGFIVGFNVEPAEAVLAQAKQKGVEIVSYRVIYDLVDEMRARMEGRLASVEERTPVGEAQVRAVFGAGKGRAAGCLVTDGYLRKDCMVEVLRGRKREVVHSGKLSSLRRVKDSVKEVPSGTECGTAIDGFVDWQEGDIITCFDVRTKTRTLEEASEGSKAQPVLAGT